MGVRKEAWEFENSYVEQSNETSFSIKTNFKILKNYLDKTVALG